VHGPPNLLERALFNLAHALSRNSKLVREISKGYAIFSKAARLQDAPFARIE
jgi:hypothetical protein